MTQRERTLVLIGAMTIGGLIAVFRGVPAWMVWNREARSHLNEVRTELDRTRLRFSRLPEVVDSMEAAASHASLVVQSAFPGTSEQASRHLASTTSSLGIPHGVIVLSTSFPANPSVDGARVLAQLQAESDVVGLVHWLGALRSGDQLVRVESLRVRSTDVTAPTDQPERLEVDLVVSGLWVPEGASPPAGPPVR